MVNRLNVQISKQFWINENIENYVSSNFQVIIRSKKTVRFVLGPSQSKAGSETLANQFANCGCKIV